MSALNFGRLLRRTRLFANKPALTDLATGWHATYGEHVPRVAAVAAGLRNLGIRSTDRVAILASPTHQYIELWHAGLAGGFVICPLNSRFTLKELLSVVEDSACKLLLYDADHAELAEALAAQSGSIEYCVAFDAKGSLESLEALTRANLGAELPLEPDEAAAAALIYTGGTTGRPKGVLLSQRAVVAAIIRIQITCGGEPDHSLLSIMPLFHVGGLAAVGWFLPSGGHTYLLPSFEPGAVLRAIFEHSITVIPGAPTMYAMLLEHPDFEPDLLSSVKLAYYGSAPMPLDLLGRLLALNPDIRFFQPYGMTEACGGVTTLRPEFHSPEHASKLSSVGQPYFDVRLEIRDPQDRTPLDTGEVGEIWVRSDTNFIEYWGQPDLTADSLVDGWYRTGDAGRLDDEGFLYLADRVKDMIVTGGENVYSIEIERALSSFPGVQQSAVVGVPDPVWGERIHAFVVGAPNKLNVPDLSDHLRRQIAAYKVPKTWTIQAEPLPLSAAGKILKTRLREAVAERNEGDPV